MSVATSREATLDADQLRHAQASLLFEGGLAAKAFAEIDSRTRQMGVPLGATDFLPIVKTRSPGIGRDLCRLVFVSSSRLPRSSIRAMSVGSITKRAR